MEKKNRSILILSFLCIVSTGLMIMSLCLTTIEDGGKFVPPGFDKTAKQGVPSNTQAEQFGWAKISQDGIPYETAICGNIDIIGEEAYVYLTNYEENDVWIKLRIIDSEGEAVAETGLVRQGEYIERVKFNRQMNNGEKIKLKIMAYEPETYYSEGSIVLNTTVKTGE